jgi:hypothetical protein
MASRKVTKHKIKNTAPRLRYGWVPDVPDQRDLLFGAIHPAVTALPPHVDLRLSCPPVENQGSLGSCTGNALAGAIE